MSRIRVPAATLALMLPVMLAAQEPQSAEAKAKYAAADIRVMAPGVVYNAGLLDLAAEYTKKTGKKVAVTSVGMGRIDKAARTAEPPADVIFLPLEMMSTLSLDQGIVHGTFTPLGRSEMGLAVRAGAPHPDISTVEKLSQVLHSAKLVMRSSTANGSMVAMVIQNKVIDRPEFAGIHQQMSTKGEGGQALARGEGDMAIQAICEIYPHPEISLVGPLPRELGAWIDMAGAVSARSMHKADAEAFLKFLLRPESNAIWKAKGLERFND